MIGGAKLAERKALAVLFAETFGDPPAFVEAVFDWHFSPETCLVFREEGRPVSMVLLPRVSFGEKTGGYVYGACTAKAFRGGGRMGRLMEAALAHMQNRGDDFSFLVPAEESLIQYYAKFGFAPGFFRKPGRWTVKTAASSPLRRAGKADFGAIASWYEQENQGKALFARRDLQFFEKYQQLSGKAGFFCNLAGYVFIDEKNTVREIGGDGENVLAALGKFLQTEEVAFLLPVTEKTAAVYGCVKPLQGDAPPLRLSLLWD